MSPELTMESPCSICKSNHCGAHLNFIQCCMQITSQKIERKKKLYKEEQGSDTVKSGRW